RLYRSLTPGLEKTLNEEEIDRVILLGLNGNVSAFESAMSDGLKSKVIGRLPAPSNPDAPAQEWLPPMEDLIEEHETEEELKLLEKIRENGVWGIQETLTMLQEHRIHTLVVPWSNLGNAYLSSGGWLAASR